MASSLVLGCGNAVGDVATTTPDDGVSEEPVPPAAPAACPYFGIDVDAWSMTDDDSPTVEVMLRVDGPPDCYLFAGNHLCNQLELIWYSDERVPLTRQTSEPSDTGWGIRECSGETCVVGDVFQISDAPAAWDHLQRLGPPVRACGRICNLDGVMEEHCEPL